MGSAPEFLRRNSGARRFIFFVAAIVFCSVLWFLFEILLPHASFAGTKQVKVPQGFGSRKIGALLRDQGVIQSKWAFVTYATLLNRASSLKPGTYTFGSNNTIPQILNELVAGESREVVLVIPEGWNLRDIGMYLEKEGVVSADTFWRVAGYPALDYSISSRPRPTDFSKEFSFLRGKSRTTGLEGYLFPDTYRVYRDATAEDIVRKMLGNFEKRVDSSFRNEAVKQGRTLSDVLAVASLVEAEVSSDKDRAIVAGILWKRLELGIPLQVDATLAYIKGTANGLPNPSDRSLLSRFNTYRYKGLPLGPVDNPGLTSLNAALHPQSGPYLYYLSTPSGKTIFSRTLEEHIAAEKKYLQ